MRQITIAQMPGSQLADEIFDQLDVALTTRREYRWRIRAFMEFVGTCQLTSTTYLEFKRHLQSRGDLRVSTKNKYLVAARILLKELHRRGLLPVDITTNVRLLQQSKKHKRDGLDDDDMGRLTSWLREQAPSPAAARLRALVCLLGLQGLRQIEVSRLDYADLDLVARTVLVRGKGRDDKEPIDLHPATVEALKSYLKVARVGDGPLLPGRQHGERLTPRSIRRVVREALDELGIDKTTHGFRHYFITKLCEAYGGDLLQVRHYTRHNSLEMLQVYDDRRRNRKDLPNYYKVFEGVVTP